MKTLTLIEKIKLHFYLKEHNRLPDFVLDKIEASLKVAFRKDRSNVQHFISCSSNSSSFLKIQIISLAYPVPVLDKPAQISYQSLSKVRLRIAVQHQVENILGIEYLPKIQYFYQKALPFEALRTEVRL